MTTPSRSRPSASAGSSSANTASHPVADAASRAAPASGSMIAATWAASARCACSIRWRPIHPTPTKASRGGPSSIAPHRLDESLRPLDRDPVGGPELVQGEAMRDQPGDVELAGANRLHRLAEPGRVHRGISFVGVDHVEPAPIPQLHVDRAGSVLVIAVDDQTAAVHGEARG